MNADGQTFTMTLADLRVFYEAGRADERAALEACQALPAGAPRPRHLRPVGDDAS